MVLGIGHIGLFLAAFVFLLTEIGVGQWVLRLVYFDIANIPAWQAGPIMRFNRRPWKKFRRRNVKSQRVDSGLSDRIAPEPRSLHRVGGAEHH